MKTVLGVWQMNSKQNKVNKTTETTAFSFYISQDASKKMIFTKDSMKQHKEAKEGMIPTEASSSNSTK